MGMVSGCYPLDPFYEARPEAARIRHVRVTANVNLAGLFATSKVLTLCTRKA